MLKVDSVQLDFGGRKILQSVYIDCKAGEVIGLLGRNGCGKSSLLKIIFGTLTPNYKYVSIDDEFIAKGYLDNKIAYLPQHNYLPQNMVINQLAPMLVDPLAWDEFSSYPLYQEHQHKKPRDLSGGELRKLETLMILYSKANYILLDEPFTHVSPIQAEDIKAIIRKRSPYKGFIITDHQYQNILEISDKIILINNGATRLIENREELVTYGYLSGN
ncbi:ATP-binding cassette domain-containing protein [Mucilaginibacter jinjuensis]|uniref:ATP-binding cassette domain-containing protein n=1 Tax=Mucilaginibacter jinjuensis TaxID=1176721 RepID=A0ABY7T477_9SPHI|nr:ATP-binding cassette domain-containing protein [Mucilaginibacter jinjuensis]WCT10512.1 ATP-binding cassette domain-containing protein [Mucilaginibacter jinjuensis]